MSSGQEKNEVLPTGGSSKDLTNSFNVDGESGPQAAEMSVGKLKNTIKWAFCLLCVFSVMILIIPSEKRIFNFEGLNEEEWEEAASLMEKLERLMERGRKTEYEYDPLKPAVVGSKTKTKMNKH